MTDEQTRPAIPQVESKLRHNILKMPEEIRTASGINIFGRRIKSLVFTTDIAVIRNCDADAVFAVYPFTPQQAISDAIIKGNRCFFIVLFCFYCSFFKPIGLMSSALARSFFQFLNTPFMIESFLIVSSVNCNGSVHI